MTRKTLGLLGAARVARMHTYLVALWRLWRHPRTPRAAKWVAFAVLAYALSPIDLIPDFIPVLGQLDDLIIVPLGVALVVRLTPKPLWAALLREAEVSAQKLPRWRWAALVVLLVWAGLLALVVAWLLRAAAPL